MHQGIWLINYFYLLSHALSFLQDNCLVLSQVNMQLVLTTIAYPALSFYQVYLKAILAEMKYFVRKLKIISATEALKIFHLTISSVQIR